MMYAGGATCLFANLVLLGVFTARRRRSHAGSSSKVRAVTTIVNDGEVELLDEEVTATISKPALIVPHITENQDESTVGGVAESLDVAEEFDDTEDQRVEAKAVVSSVAAERRKERRDQRRVQENVRKMMEDLPPPPIPGIEPSATASDSPSRAATELPLPPPPTTVTVDQTSSENMELDSADKLPLPPPPSASAMRLADRQQLCPDCGAKIKVRNIDLTKVNCPVCDTTVEL
jgi:hypothetical protein